MIADFSSETMETKKNKRGNDNRRNFGALGRKKITKNIGKYNRHFFFS